MKRKRKVKRKKMVKEQPQKASPQVSSKVYGEPSAAANLALTAAVRTLEAEKVIG